MENYSVQASVTLGVRGQRYLTIHTEYGRLLVKEHLVQMVLSNLTKLGYKHSMGMPMSLIGMLCMILRQRLASY